MANFLDRMPPFDFSDPAARDLWTLLSTNYQSKPPVRDMLIQVHADTAEIDWDNSMRWVWTDILTLTHKQAKLRPLLEQITNSGDEAIVARLKELMAASPVGSVPQPDPKATTWRGFGDRGLEKVIQAEPTFLDTAFLRRGVELGAAVCRLLVTLSGTQYYGTAFRITQDLLLTNHHVLFDQDHGNARATAVEAWFRYERTFGGLDMAHTVVACDPATIVGDTAHDWATIKVIGAMPEEAPLIELRGAEPVKADDRVYIIQHPSGAPKKIGMIHNVVRYVDNQVVQYLTDTEGGSSGSPVFNQGQRIERVVEGMHAAKVI